jgi:NitT/TauT family transport system substrate-binding protein
MAWRGRARLRWLEGGIMDAKAMTDDSTGHGAKAGGRRSLRLSRRSLIGGAAVALAAPFAAKARAADRLTLRLDYTASGLHAPFYVGLQRGWFDKAGIDLYMEDGNGSNATVQLVGAGSFDLGLHSLAPLVVARAKGLPLISVAGFVRKGELGFLVPKESGWTSPKDLIGKKIAYGETSQEGPFVRYFLALNGVKEDQVELVNVDAASRYAVYFTKQVDSLVTTVPGVMPIAAQHRPSTAIVLADFGLNIPGLGMGMLTDTLAKKQDAVRRFISVVCGAWTYVLDGHEQEGAEAVFAKKPNGAFTIAMMSEQIRLFKPFFYTDATRNMPIGMQSEDDWAHTLKSMVDAKVIAPGTKPADYFTNECIDKAIVDKVASNSY